MFVTSGATEKIRKKRQESFYEDFISPLVSEASKLGLSKDEINSLIERGYKNGD